MGTGRSSLCRQPELARLSTRGKQIVFDSSQEMPTEHPEVVISAIYDVWLAAHKSGVK
jgi:hypothetical protein